MIGSKLANSFGSIIVKLPPATGCGPLFGTPVVAVAPPTWMMGAEVTFVVFAVVAVVFAFTFTVVVARPDVASAPVVGVPTEVVDVPPVRVVDVDSVDDVDSDETPLGAAVEGLWLLPPHAAVSIMMATTPTWNVRLTAIDIGRLGPVVAAALVTL